MFLGALTRPAEFLMGRLKFMGKFALIASLFAVPFLYSVVQIVANNEKDINTLKSRHKTLLYITDIQRALHQAETVRDLSPLATLTPNTSVNKLFTQNLKILDKAIDTLQHDLQYYQESILIKSSIKSLRDEFQRIDIETKTEISFVEEPFDAEHQLVKKFYRLQSRLADQSGMLSDNDTLTLQLISLALEEINDAFYLMGKARAFGIFYLERGHVNSNGGKLLEDTYNQLNSMEEKLTDHYKNLTSKFPELDLKHNNHTSLLSSIRSSREDIDSNVIQDDRLTQPWKTYLHNHTVYLNDLIAFKQQLLKNVSQRYQQRIKHKEKLQQSHMIQLGILIALFFYLLFGLYLNIRNSLKQLCGAAHAIAEGELNHAIELNSNDELKQLAIDFNRMRLLLKLRQKELIELATKDELTQLFNRKYINDEFPKQLSMSTRACTAFTVLLLDIDFFKKVNDNYGHPAGDHALKEVARTLRNATNRASDIVARYGGEEFIMLLNSTDKSGGEHLANDICKKIRQLNITFEGHAIPLTISIGISSTDGNKEINQELLIKCADQALYEAKGNGRDQWVTHKIPLNETL